MIGLIVGAEGIDCIKIGGQTNDGWCRARSALGHVEKRITQQKTNYCNYFFFACSLFQLENV